MKIQSISFFNINKIHKKNTINFGAAKSCKKAPACDTFEKFTDADTKFVTIKTLDGKDIQARIEKEKYDDLGIYGKNPEQFNIIVDGKQLGYEIVCDYIDKDCLYVDELYTEADCERQYKGAGTELLKCAVQESKKRGYDGRIKLDASNIPAPYAFYYKNNFSANNDLQPHNAAIDYAVRNNIPVAKVLPKTMTSLDMHIDEKGAQALLEGRRLYEKRDFKILAETKDGCHKYQTNYIEAPQEGFYLQIVDTDEKNLKQKWLSKGEITEDENGEKCIKLHIITNYLNPDKEENLVQKAIEIITDELECKNIKICKETIFKGI